MPLISSEYQAPFLFNNGHVQTIYCSVFRWIRDVHYRRERIATPDGDFLDLDWSRVGAQKLAILTHGLEGSSTRSYIRGMVRALNRAGWDALAWNFRSSSGEINKKPRFYHSGATEDLHTVVQHVLDQYTYPNLVLVGFSLGGNLSLKYLGEREVPREIKKCVAFSVPCNLKASANYLARPANKIYMHRFVKMFRKKIVAKIKMFPGQMDERHYKKMRTFQEWDDYYTAPLHGFKNAEDYWEQCSAQGFIANIKTPTLLINARNDPFLPKECYPVGLASNHRFFNLEIPSAGGHVGFLSRNHQGDYWSERRALQFIQDI